MVELNIYWLYWLSGAVHPLDFIQEGTPLSVVAENLVIARNGLKGMQREGIFPKTSARMGELAEVIDSLIPPGVPWLQDRQITPLEVERLRNGSKALALTLEEESRHNYVLYIEDQRYFSAYTLVENIENCFSKESWQAIGDDAKREFVETGRCLALERYTGAGFHALRAVECVIRQCIVKLTGEVPTKRDWGNYITVLKANGVSEKVTDLLDNIRSRERNPLMHPEAWLVIDDALGLFSISQTAIDRLAGVLRGTP